MKRILLVLIFSLWATCANAAELLVKANDHWMDSLTQAEVDKMDASQLASYKARSQKGDIIVVRPDGWQWGKEECLPRFIVVKVPGLSVAAAKQYENSLYDTTDPLKPIMLRVRKNTLPKTDVVAATTGTVTLTNTVLTNKVIIKTGAAGEITPPATKVSYYFRKIKTLAYDWFIRPAYAATQLKKTVKPSGGDYTSIEACMNANEQNLVTAEKYFDVEIDGAWSSADTTAVTIHNYTTDATRYINIYTTTAARHNGTAQAVSGLNSYRLIPTFTGNGNVITLSYESNTTITGLEVSAVTGGNDINGISCAASNGKQSVVGCVIHGALKNGIALDGSGIAINNIVYGTTYIGINFTNSWSSPNLAYNNTIYCSAIGIAVNGKTAINNISVSSDGSSYTSTAGTFTTNGSDDTTGNAGLQNLVASDLFVNIGSGTEDFHLKADADAIDVGTDLSGTFTTDIDGVTRTGTWDIGADEYSSGGSSSPTFNSLLFSGD